ncbi:MAG: KH domain-containing protein [Clostridiales bacterium]|nr:KH domain-containing protein [Clostridiales bacterium]
MEELVRYLVLQMVTNKDAVRVTESEDGVISVSVDKSDMGKIIGRQGKIAKSIRTIVKAASAGGEKAYSVDILEAE